MRAPERMSDRVLLEASRLIRAKSERELGEFCDVLETDVGKWIIEDLLLRIGRLRESILAGTHKPEDREVYKYLRGMLHDWALKIKEYKDGNYIK